MQEFKRKYIVLVQQLQIISNEEMNDLMKIVEALKDSNILLNGVTKTITNETKEQKGGFLSTLLGTLAASLLGNTLAGKGIVREDYGNKKGNGILKTVYGSKTRTKKKPDSTSSSNKL